MAKLAARTLLVGDDATFREGLADLLRRDGQRYEHHVFTAPDGLVALQMMDEVTPDLIISDIVMPKMGGHEFLTKIRGEPAWIHIPFIILTSKHDRREVEEGHRLRAELFITMPIQVNEFVELVESQLDRMFELLAAREKGLLALKQNILQLLNHEFRTPLTYVTAYYEMLAESLGSLEETHGLQDYLRGIRVGCLRLTQLVRDLVFIMEMRTGDAARRYADEAEIIPDIGKIVQRVATLRQQDALAKNITIQSHIASDLPTTFGHAASLQDALDRLVENAIKFTPSARHEPSTIWLEAKVDAGWLSMSVHDQGIGFPGYVATQVFEPFYQHNRQLMEQQGSGSGLAIVKAIVDLHGGKIEVESEENIGSSFRILLPAHQKGESREVRDGEMASKHAVVLLVEDDVFLLEGLRELLELYEGKYALEVLTAANGRIGLSTLESYRPDLIISDVMMPEMDGYAFLHEVRKRAAWLQIPIIFLTARSGKQERHKGLLSGVEEYISKPYDIDDLLQLVVTQLDRHFELQSVVFQGFEEVKRSILSLLRPDFMVPLEIVDKHSRKLESRLAEVKTDRELKSSLVSIQEASATLADLVKDFIALAEFRTGEAELSFASRARLVSGEELHELLNEQRVELHRRAAELAVTFESTIAPDLPTILYDTHAIGQCIVRLFEIALKFLRNGHDSRLAFSAEANLDTLTLAIRVSGASLRIELTEKLIQLNQESDYENLEMPDSEVGPSLMVIKGLLALHDGQLLVHNERNSVQMTMLLPVLREPATEFPAVNSLRA